MQLRDKTLQTLEGAMKVTPKDEWQFIIQSARLYDRMGCDLLALDLVRNWQFLLTTSVQDVNDDITLDPRKLLRRRSSLVVADMPTPLSRKSGPGTKKSQPTMFEEPASSSLLDSFGF